MNDDEHKTEINIERVLIKERRYNLVKIFLIIISLIITLGYISFQANQLKQDNKKTREYIACITMFFTQVNRQNKTLVDIDSCKVKEAAVPASPNIASSPTNPIYSSVQSSTPVDSFFLIQPITVPQNVPEAVQIHSTTNPSVSPIQTVVKSVCPLLRPVEVVGDMFRCQGDLMWQNGP